MLLITSGPSRLSVKNRIRPDGSETSISQLSLCFCKGGKGGKGDGRLGNGISGEGLESRSV